MDATFTFFYKIGSVDNFLNYLNEQVYSNQFTIELQKDKTLSVLDISV